MTHPSKAKERVQEEGKTKEFKGLSVADCLIRSLADSSQDGTWTRAATRLLNLWQDVFWAPLGTINLEHRCFRYLLAMSGADVRTRADFHSHLVLRYGFSCTPAAFEQLRSRQCPGARETCPRTCARSCGADQPGAGSQLGGLQLGGFPKLLPSPEVPDMWFLRSTSPSRMTNSWHGRVILPGISRMPVRHTICSHHQGCVAKSCWSLCIWIARRSRSRPFWLFGRLAVPTPLCQRMCHSLVGFCCVRMHHSYSPILRTWPVPSQGSRQFFFWKKLLKSPEPAGA